MVMKPSEKEEEYFARWEFERRKKIEDEKHKKITGKEKQRLKELHFLKCPKCGMELIEVDYKGIKVDGLVKSLLERHPGESRGPEHLEITGFRLSPE